jgi:hypothetical protein
MNKASKQRVEWAGSVAAVYAGHPGVRAVIVAGSVARGTAHAHSDIDLGIFWTEVASEQDRSDLIRRIGGRRERWVENRRRYGVDNPRRQGCIEIVALEATSAAPGLKLDLEHQTVAGTERVLVDVVDEHDPSLEKQELLSVIQDGIALDGDDVVDRWREKTQRYPDELALKMVTQNLAGIGRRLSDQVHWARTQDWFCLYESFLDIGRRLLLTLMGLNRVWAFTDNPNFKGHKSVVDGFELQPDRFADRLGRLLQSHAFHGIRGFVDLVEDVLTLVEVHMPAVSTMGEREMLGHVRRRTSRYV